MKLFITVFLSLIFSMSLFAQDTLKIHTRDNFQNKEQKKSGFKINFQNQKRANFDKFVDLDGDGICDNLQGNGLTPFNKHNFQHQSKFQHKNRFREHTTSEIRNQRRLK